MTTGLSQSLADHFSDLRFEQLPEEAVEATKRSLLDALAVSLAATGLEPAVQPFIAQARRHEGTGRSDIIGHRLQTSAQHAAFANGALAHAIDFEDAYDAAPMHPNAPLVPALLAVAQMQGEVNGKILLTAMAGGCDLACRLGLSVTTPAEAGGWYPPPIYAGFGAIAAAGVVVGLDARGFLDAFSMGLNQITCSGEIKYNPQSAIRAVRDAFPANAAIVSVELAAAGMRGFDKPFEGECGFFRLYVRGEYSKGVLLHGLGARFMGADVSFKAWPCCRGTHAFIEAGLELREQLPSLDDIDRITLTGGPILNMLAEPLKTKRRPSVPIDAKFSLYYCAAFALVHGAVNLDSFSDAAMQDSKVLRLAEKISFEDNGQTDAKDASSGTMSILMKDGRKLEQHVTEPRGGLSNPMSREELVDKAIDCGARAQDPVSEARMRQLSDLIWRLETVDEAAERIFEIIRPE